MRKSGWAAATGLGSLVLLLAACGGSSGSSHGRGLRFARGPREQRVVRSGRAGVIGDGDGAATASKTGGSTPTASAKPHHSVGPQPSTGDSRSRRWARPS